MMNVFIRRYDDHYEWFATSAEALKAESFQGSLEDLAQYYRANTEVSQWVLIAPATDIATRAIAFSERERKHILKTLPSELEECLLADAEDLHYVTDKPAATSIDVVAIDQEKLEQWLADFDDNGIAIDYCLPETKMLIETEAPLHLFYRQGGFVLQINNAEGGSDNGSDSLDSQTLGYDAEHIALAIELATDGFSSLPSSIELLADDEEALEEAVKHLPQAIVHLLDQKTLAYADMLQLQFSKTAKVWNMLTGQYARSKEYLSMLLPWRWVAITFAVVFSMHCVMLFVEYKQYKQEYSQMKTQMNNVFRQAIPKGKIVNHRKQLERRLTALKQGGSGESFMATMNVMGAVLANYKVTSLNGLNYDREKSEIRLDFLVDNYDQLQKIIDELKAQGLTADIQNSSAQDDKLRARLKITG